jgi:hypothetical protein
VQEHGSHRLVPATAYRGRALAGRRLQLIRVATAASVLADAACPGRAQLRFSALLCRCRRRGRVDEAGHRLQATVTGNDCEVSASEVQRSLFRASAAQLKRI